LISTIQFDESPMMRRDEESTADFTAASNFSIYISGYHTFETVGEEVDLTVKLYDEGYLRGSYVVEDSGRQSSVS